MIEEVRIQNFKSVEKLKLKLGQVTVLIGANGSGKSNILEAITMGGAAIANKLDNEFLVSRGIRVTEPALMCSAFEKAKEKLSFTIEFLYDGNPIKFDFEILEINTQINKVIDKFIKVIGKNFYEKNQDRIIFAIAVNAIECWLLPLYYTDKRKSKTTNCLDTLNQILEKKEGFTIDEKKPVYYRTIVKPYQKHRKLSKHHADNPSLEIFLQHLDAKNIEFINEDNW